MKKHLIASLCFSIMFLGCTNGSKQPNVGKQAVSASKTILHIHLQPMGDFSHQQAILLQKEMEKHLCLGIGADIKICSNIAMPTSCLYKPRNRYWAGKMLGYLKSEAKDVVTIGLTNKDISTSIHGEYNYGIMGLSLRPGNACIVSTFRLKRKDDLWKVTIHELLHSRGLPHCKQDNPRCIMQDAHGKNTFYMKQGICEDCKKRMKSFTQ